VGNTTILKLFDIDFDHAANKHIVCGLFDHGGTQKGIFTIKNNPVTGVFDSINEMIATTNNVPGAYQYNQEDYPAMIEYDNEILLGFEGTQIFPNGTITETAMAKFAMVNGVQAMILLKKYNLPSDKSNMRFLKMIKTDTGIKALLSLVSNTNSLNSWAVADVNPSTLDLTNFKEFEFLDGVNEEFPVDIIEVVNEIFVVSRFTRFNGSAANVDTKLKLNNVTQLTQNPNCFPVIDHVVNSYKLLILGDYQHFTGNISFSEGADDSNMYPFEFDGYEKDCMGITYTNYKKSVEKTSITNTPLKTFVSKNELLNFSIPEHYLNLKTIHIYSIDGKLVKSMAPTGNQTIDIRSFETGSYVAVFIFENGFSQSAQFIK